MLKKINKILYNNDNLINMPDIEPFKTLKKFKEGETVVLINTNNRVMT